MKTVLVTTCWLDNEEYTNKTKKWINYYKKNSMYLNFDEIILLDNASKFENIEKILTLHPEVVFRRFSKHISRTAHLEYGYLWRAIYFYQELFKDYDKIIYMDNDAYIISDKMMTRINKLKVGWISPFCAKHKFPETGIQIVTKDCKEYRKFIDSMTENEFNARYNGMCMETTLPLTKIDKDLNGDRHSESGIFMQPVSVDFSTQVPLTMDIKFNE